jgi:hypothetical protein
VARTRTARTERKGVSLAKGPVAIVGLAMIAFGVISFLAGGDSFTTNAPDGTVTGDTFLGIEGNGWTNVLWVGGGLLLVLAAPMHWGAKTMALIVGIALGAAAIITLVRGDDVFGIFAANDMTTLVWGAVAAGLLLLALLPRVGRKRHVATTRDDRVEGRHEAEPLEREAYERGRRDAEREHATGTHETRRFDRDRDARPTEAEAETHEERDRGGFRRR